MRNIAMIIIAASLIGAVVAYNYSVDRTKQEGLRFGIELEKIQEDVKDMQDKFYSEKAMWEEGDISHEELLTFYEDHTNRFEDVIDRYDALEPPEIFEGSVQLLKLSSETQLESDREFIEWMKTGSEESIVRSDVLLQDALEYEMHGLVEFYSAKTGFKTYDEPEEQFVAPQKEIVQRTNMVWEHMVAECDEKFDVVSDSAKSVSDDGSIEDVNVTTRITSGAVNPEWASCIAEAGEWRDRHLP